METSKRVVKEIPALFRPNMSDITTKENVTYYARVSTDFDEQEESYERQKAHFEELIKSHPEWNYVEGYADQGISGTKAESRPEFMRMINDAREGKINRILIKSMSRFARNTVDTLSYIRELKEIGVSVFFENEGIDTMAANGEVLITILAAVAEQESRGISTNIKWSYKKRFQEGKVVINYKTVMGYDKVDDNYVIVENEAKVIKRIFLEYIAGKTIRQIATTLNEEKITTKLGNAWTPSAIQGVLANEKYTGNSYLAKTYKADVLSKKRVKNTGQATKYYVENSHPAIITQEIYDMAQEEKKHRTELRSSANTGNGKYSSKNSLSGLLICSECGSNFRRHGRRVADGSIVKTWVCINHQNNNSSCKMLPIKETDILDAYKRVIERFSGDLSELVEMVKETINSELNNDCSEDLEPIETKINDDRKLIMELFQKKRNNEIAIEKYNEEYARLSCEIHELEEDVEKKKSQNINIQIKKEKMKIILDTLSKEKVDLYDQQIMRKLIEYIKVINKHTIEFQFKCDLKITEEI